MNHFLNSITDLVINILGFSTTEPMIILTAICLCIFTFGVFKWLF